MILTTIVAVLLTTRHFILDIYKLAERNYDLRFTDWILLVMYIAPLFPAVWAALGRGRPLIRISIVLPFVFLFLFLLLYKTKLVWNNGELYSNPIYAWSVLWWTVSSCSLFTLPTAVIFFSLLVVRSCGYRLVRVRWEKLGQETDEPIENNLE